MTDEIVVQPEITGNIPEMLALISGSYFDLVSGSVVQYSDYRSQIPLYPDGLYPGVMWNPGELGYTGYHFMGFASYPNAPEPLFMLSGDISDSSLYPVWYPKTEPEEIPIQGRLPDSGNIRTHTVTFAVAKSLEHKFSGELPSAVTLKYGSELDIAGYWDDKMTASGLHFAGWTTNPNFPTVIPRIVVSQDITLYAVWYSAKVPYHKPKTFSVSFGNGSTLRLNQHSTIRLRGFNPDGLSYAGYTLEGWSNYSNADTSLFHLLVRDDIFLYPVWVKEPEQAYYEEPILPEPPVVDPYNEEGQDGQPELEWYHPNSPKHPYHKDNPYSVFAENNPYDTLHPGYPFGETEIDWSLFPDDPLDIYYPYAPSNPYNPENTHRIRLTDGVVINPDNVYAYTSFQLMNGALRAPLYKGVIELRQQFLEYVPDIYKGDFKNKQTFCEEPHISDNETITLTVDNTDGTFIIPTGGLSSSGAPCLFDWDIWIDYEYVGRWTGNSGLRSQGITLDLYNKPGIAAASVSATPRYEAVNREREFEIPVKVVSDGQWRCVPFWILLSDSGLLRGKSLGIYSEFLSVVGFREIYSGTTTFTVNRQSDQELNDRLLQGFVFYPTRKIENCAVEVVLLDFDNPVKLFGTVCIFGQPIFDPVELGVRQDTHNYEPCFVSGYDLDLVCGEEDREENQRAAIEVAGIHKQGQLSVCEYDKPRFSCDGPQYDLSAGLFPKQIDSVLSDRARCVLKGMLKEISEIIEPTVPEQYVSVDLGLLYESKDYSHDHSCEFDYSLNICPVQYVSRTAYGYITELIKCLRYDSEHGKSKITIRPHYRAAFSYGWLRAFGFSYSSIEQWNLPENKDKLLEVEMLMTPAMFCDSGTDAGNYCMRDLFYGCRNLNLGRKFNFTTDWSRVTHAGNAFMFRAFRDCESLGYFPLNYKEPQGFTTVGEDFKAYKCYGCKNLRSLGVENTEPSGIINASYGYGRFEYYGCESLLKLPDIYTEPKQIISADLYDFQLAKFMNCSKLLYLPNRYRETDVTAVGDNYLAYKFNESGLTHLPKGYKEQQPYSVGDNCHVCKFAGCVNLRSLHYTYVEIDPVLRGTNFLKWKFRDSLLGDITYASVNAGICESVKNFDYEPESNFSLWIGSVQRQNV